MSGFAVGQRIQKDESVAARRTVYVTLNKSSDHVSLYNTALSSKTLPLSKNGGAQAASTNDAAAVDTTNLPGLYSLVLTAAEVDTLGVLLVSGKISGISCEGGAQVEIVDFDPYAQGALSEEDLRFRASQRP